MEPLDIFFNRTCKIFRHPTKEWNKDGLLHREDGPAMEYADGHKEWWVNGKLHREDGPAIVRKGGSKEWWMNGKKYSEEEFSNWLSKKKFAEKLTEQLEEKPTGKRVKI